MKISEVSEFLERAFDILNQRYFDGELPRAVITIQSSPRAYGHFTPYLAWSEDGEGFPEINLGAENLNRPTANTIATLVHEMVHFYCHIKEIKDTSRGGTYHNRRFKTEAEKRDLIIEHDPRIGYSITTPSDALTAFVEAQGWGGVSLARMWNYGLSGGKSGGQGVNGIDGSEGKKKSNVRKYQCPNCKCSCRATKDINIGCLDCGVVMELQNVG